MGLLMFLLNYLGFVSAGDMNTFAKHLSDAQKNSVHLFDSSLNNSSTIGKWLIVLDGNWNVVDHKGGCLQESVLLSDSFLKAEQRKWGGKGNPGR